jgi:hypothetical protein
MISRSTGEVNFQDLRILPQAVLQSSAIQKSHALPLPGWIQQFLGVHDSEHGSFEVEAVSDAQQRVQMLLLAHSHPFYQPDTPDDAERHAFHEGIIDSDLSGQREFSWGAVLCRLDTKANKDRLVVAYTIGPHVPMTRDGILLHLKAREPGPRNV